MTPPTPQGHDNPKAWTTTTSLTEIAQWLRGKRRVVVLTHSKPDGDAVGSTVALVRAINLSRAQAAGVGSLGGLGVPPASLDAGAEVWYFGPQPPWYRHVIQDTAARVLEHSCVPPADASEPDAIVILDTGSWSQVEPAEAWLRARHDRIAVIDHHVQGDPELSSRRFVETKAAAVCQPVAELCRIILGKRHLTNLPVEVAEALYLGIGTDTGWFKHSNVNPEVLRTSADLLEAGVRHFALYEQVEQQDRPARLKLLARALASLELHQDGRIATMMLTRKDFHECAAEQGDAGGFAEYAQALECTRVTAMLTESEPDTQGRAITKISLRSKNSADSPDVNVAAKNFGGGGHVRAAGARVNAPIGEVKARVVEVLKKA